MNQIIVGMDGSAGGRSALAWALHLAGDVHADILALTAFSAQQSEMPPGLLAQMRADRVDELASWCGGSLQGAPLLRLQVVDGDPREVLMDAASTDPSDMIVVGRQGARGAEPGFLHTGSVVEYLCHHAEVPLAIVPTGAPAKIERLVVALDGSSPSDAMCDWLSRFASQINAAVFAVGVEQTPFLELSTGTAEARQGLEFLIRDRWAKALGDEGVPFVAIGKRNAHPVDALLNVCRDEHADLLVAGLRGGGGFRGLRLGGVAIGLVHEAHLPLLLVPPTPA